MRFAIWLGDRPVYCQTTETTGMLMLGKMSVGVLRTAMGPRIINRSARRTIHISFQLLLTTSGGNAANEVNGKDFLAAEIALRADARATGVSKRDGRAHPYLM